MQHAAQFSVFLVNQPGVLAKVISAIAEARVNIIALTIVDSQEHGVLRIVGQDPARMRKVLGALNLPIHEASVLSADLPNRPGALAGLLSQLAEQHVNIDYAYVTSGSPGGRTTAILKVDQPKKAEKLLTRKTKRDSKRSTVKSRASRKR